MGIDTDGTSKFIAGKKKRQFVNMGATQKRPFATRIRPAEAT